MGEKKGKHVEMVFLFLADKSRPDRFKFKPVRSKGETE